MGTKGLNKNLNFCPTPKRYNKKQLKNYIDTFIRKAKLKAHFKNKEKDTENQVRRISRTKAWTPKENHHTVETFTQIFHNDLLKEQENIKQILHKYLPKKEKEALQNLCKRNYIIITKADKGGAAIIADVDDYIREANWQLDNKELCKKLTIDRTETNRIEQSMN